MLLAIGQERSKADGDEVAYACYGASPTSLAHAVTSASGGFHSEVSNSPIWRAASSPPPDRARKVRACRTFSLIVLEAGEASRRHLIGAQPISVFDPLDGKS
jgi:hypothetical protein